ncbi:hypothetical protein AY586_07795 [Marichromatium gracile]|uniref:Uncharacterized protein n=1 Tax=Marichromatium gracile TaxID=1048 RepID=A0ABR5VJV5_MARGR|nr:hypothetical protein AY586_07795 [Marichromatium gracile]
MLKQIGRHQAQADLRAARDCLIQGAAVETLDPSPFQCADALQPAFEMSQLLTIATEQLVRLAGADRLPPNCADIPPQLPIHTLAIVEFEPLLVARGNPGKLADTPSQIALKVIQQARIDTVLIDVGIVFADASEHGLRYDTSQRVCGPTLGMRGQMAREGGVKTTGAVYWQEFGLVAHAEPWPGCDSVQVTALENRIQQFFELTRPTLLTELGRQQRAWHFFADQVGPIGDRGDGVQRQLIVAALVVRQPWPPKGGLCGTET